MKNGGSSKTFGFSFKKSHKKRGPAQDIDFSSPTQTLDVNNNSLEQNIVEITVPSENITKKSQLSRTKSRTKLFKSKSEDYDNITVLKLQPTEKE